MGHNSGRLSATSQIVARTESTAPYGTMQMSARRLSIVCRLVLKMVRGYKIKQYYSRLLFLARHQGMLDGLPWSGGGATTITT